MSASLSISRRLLEYPCCIMISCHSRRRQILQNRFASDGQTSNDSPTVAPLIEAACPPPGSVQQCFASDTCTNILVRVLEACSYRLECVDGSRQPFQRCSEPRACSDRLKLALPGCEEVNARVVIALICARVPFIFTGNAFLFAELPAGVSIDLLPDGVTLDQFRTTSPDPSPPSTVTANVTTNTTTITRPTSAPSGR